MPAWGRRGSYVGVTTTIAVLAAIGVFTSCSKDLIPPPEFNDLAAYRARFLSRAGRQGIRWKTTDNDPFAEAARLGRPVMVFAGTSASQAARRFDDEVFTNPEVWARLNRDFVCVRVDFGTEPEWRSAFLPVLRNTVGADPGFAIWFFKPNGQLLTWIGRRAWADSPDFNDFLGRLSEVSSDFASLPTTAWSQSESEQRAESAVLHQTTSRAVPDMDALFASMVQSQSFFQWKPGRYRALLQAGREDDAAFLLKSELASPRADLLDGGFFRIGSGASPALVEFDKSAATNAEMLSVLALAFDATGDPLFDYWYRRTELCVAEQFMDGAPWSSYVENPVAEDGRSLRNSFSVAALRTEVPADARGFAERLGLDPRRNPLMAPYLADPSLAGDEGVETALAALRKVRRKSEVVPGRDDALDSAGVVVARSIEAALVMGDQTALERALAWARRLREFRAGTDEVVHSTFGRGLGRKWLGDFAAYADAALMAYTATGDEDWLADGTLVLRRALELFVREQGVVSVAGAHAHVGPLSLEMPSVVDNGAPPALALFMSVCFRYGAVLGDAELRRLAVEVAERFSSTANLTPQSFTAFLCSAQEVMLTGCRVARDPQKGALRAAAVNPEMGPAGSADYLGTAPARLGPLVSGNGPEAP
jgi:uncharacterized protein YyaL (SSP411 family)